MLFNLVTWLTECVVWLSQNFACAVMTTSMYCNWIWLSQYYTSPGSCNLARNSYNSFQNLPCQQGLDYDDCILCRWVRSFQKECPRFDTKLYLMVRFQYWRSGRCGIFLHCNYSQVHSDHKKNLYETTEQKM